MITEEDVLRRGSCGSLGAASAGSRSRSSPATSAGLSMFRGPKEGPGAAMNGEMVVLYRADDDDGHQQNGKSSAIITPKRVGSLSTQQKLLKDACEQRLLDTSELGDMGEAHL